MKPSNENQEQKLMQLFKRKKGNTIKKTDLQAKG